MSRISFSNFSALNLNLNYKMLYFWKSNEQISDTSVEIIFLMPQDDDIVFKFHVCHCAEVLRTWL